MRKKDFGFSIDEQIVADYSLEEIAEAKADMIRNKYSTRLERKSSREIVKLYAKRYKKRSIPPIAKLLEDIENKYKKYEWTPQRLSEFRRKEKIEIQENERAIASLLEKYGETA